MDLNRDAASIQGITLDNPKSTRDKNGKPVTEMTGSTLPKTKKNKFTIRAYSDKWVIMWGKQDGKDFFTKFSGYSRVSVIADMVNKLKDLENKVPQTDKHKDAPARNKAGETYTESLEKGLGKSHTKIPASTNAAPPTPPKADPKPATFPRITTTYIFPLEARTYALNNGKLPIFRIVSVKPSRFGMSRHSIGVRWVLKTNGTWGYKDVVIHDNVETYSAADMLANAGVPTHEPLENIRDEKKVNETIKELLASLQDAPF